MPERPIVDSVSSFLESDEIPDDSMLRTPSVTDSTGGAISENQARERGRMVKTADQVVQLAFENGLKVSPSIEAALLPTPNTMEHREIKSPEQIAALKEKSPGGYRNLREEVIHNLPTPTANDWKGPNRADSGTASTNSIATKVDELFRTPKALDGIKGNLKTSAEREANGNHVDLTNQANDFGRLAPNGELQATIQWGKFEPAIRRWERVTGFPAPAPTRPDGKDGAHRLNPEFTEWLMGLEPGWLTDQEIGLTRNEQLKACGNGVVPQQAEMALRSMLEMAQKFAVGTVVHTSETLRV